MVCQRCRGLLVHETFCNLRIEESARYHATRCINCGCIEDAIILANRVRNSGSTQGIQHMSSGNVECTMIHTEVPA